MVRPTRSQSPIDSHIAQYAKIHIIPRFTLRLLTREPNQEKEPNSLVSKKAPLDTLKRLD
jgi:hypothetical protein